MNMIGNPHSFVDELFNMSTINKNSKFSVSQLLADLGDEKVFNTQLNDVNFMENVPSFNYNYSEGYSPNTLVKYHGIVQDLYDPEFYCGAIRNFQTGDFVLSKYRDIIHSGWEIGDDDDENILYLERTALMCIPIPGENIWTLDGHSEQDVCLSVISSKTKRSHEQMSLDERVDDSTRKVSRLDGESSKLIQCDGNDSCAMSNVNIGVHSSSTPCLVRVYDGNTRAAPRLLDLVEFLCVYTHDPLHSDTGLANDQNISCLADFDQGSLSGVGFGAQRYPHSSVAPRLHSVAWRRLGSSYPLLMTLSDPSFVLNYTSPVVAALQTLLPVGGGQPSSAHHVLCLDALLRTSVAVGREETHWEVEVASMLGESRLREARSGVLSSLTAALAGDTLSAEYVLLAVLSRVYARHDETTALGCVSVELCDLDANDARVGAVMNVLSLVVPRCVRICVDAVSLNSSHLQPVKHEETNWMSRSALQLAAGTVLLLDNSAQHAECPLDTTGKRSAEALRGVVTSQLLQVDCGYSSVSVPTDLPCLLFSTATSRCDLIGDSSSVVRVAPLNGVGSTSHIPMDCENAENCAWLSCARLWWATVRLMEPVMAEDTLLLAEADFVRVRNQGDSSVPLVEASDFHHWLTLARLMALSLGESRITVDHWRRVRTMETERMQRIAKE